MYTQYATLADTYGYYVIYPNSPHEADHCFDVDTPETLTHGAGGDSQGIASMVSHAISHWGVSPFSVYVTGTSSGAMMTNVMAVCLSRSFPITFAEIYHREAIPTSSQLLRYTRESLLAVSRVTSTPWAGTRLSSLGQDEQNSI